MLGLSDHTMGISVPIAAVTLGACVIEKHVTLSRADGGVDSAFSLEIEELKMLVAEVNNASQALGPVSYGIGEKEEKSKIFRRSVYFVNDMEPGELITEHHIRCVRPDYGAQPQFYEKLIGKSIATHVEAGDPVSHQHIASIVE